MIDSVDPAVIRKMCQKEKKHLRYDKIGENEGKEIRQVPYEQLKDFLKAGTYPVDFALYRQGKDRQTLSMADMGFQKPDILCTKKTGSIWNWPYRKSGRIRKAESCCPVMFRV